MHCPNCQFENARDARFCEDCGAELERGCPACGVTVRPAQKFCRACGHNLETAKVTPGKPTTSNINPTSYIPKHLADRILSSRNSLEGERKQVTVLFADIVDSTKLIEHIDPEEALQILEPALDAMITAVHRYEGTITRVVGDGVMALFGAPLAQEDHAVRGCYAALDMQKATQQVAQNLELSHGVPMRIRVGLNSGEVVVKAIGNDLRVEYDAVGVTAALAARTEALAAPGTVALTAKTLALAEGFVRVKALGRMPMKGVSEPVEVFELTGPGRARMRLHAAVTRGLTRFVGRDAEMGALNRGLDHARDGHGQVVGFVGEPGVGKSRVVREFTHSDRTQGWLVLESGSVSYGKATAYLPLIDLFKVYFEIETEDDEQGIRAKVSGKLRALDEALMPTLPAFLELLNVEPDNPEWQALEPRQRGQRTIEAAKRLVLRESHVQPVCLVFEDLHWIDLETQAFLDSLLEGIPTVRVFLLVNYRPEYRHGWARKSYYTQLRIDPLPPESAEDLLAALLGNRAEFVPVKRLLIDQTEGNPLFLEESVRTLVETEVLVGERGAYRLAKVLSAIQVPATVQALLAARIDRLATDDKHLLQCASVIGKDVPFSLLQAIAELPEEQLHLGLSRLQGAELLYETRLFPQLEYTFKHALTHEVAYEGLLHERQRQLHARIVNAIEALAGDRRAEQVEQLAHHALRGEVWEKAVDYLRQAGAKAVSRSANREAVGYFAQALVALQHLPETRDTLEQAVDIRLDLRVALIPLGEVSRIFNNLSEAEPLVTALDDQARMGRLAAYLSNHYYLAGTPERAIEFGRRSLAIATATQDFALQLEMHFRLGQTYYAQGKFQRAIDVLEEGVGMLTGDRIRERSGLPALPSVICRTWLAHCFAEQGKFTKGMAVAEEGVRIAEEGDHPLSMVFAYWGIGHLHLRKIELEQATAMFARGVELCKLWTVRVWFPRLASSLGAALALSGRHAEALPLLEQAVEESDKMKVAVDQSRFRGRLGEAHLLQGRIDEAVKHAQLALELSVSHGERAHEAWAERLFGEIYSRPGHLDVDRAHDHYQRALALAHNLEMRPLVARCHLGLAKLYRQTGAGTHQKAAAHFDTATALCRELGMRLPLEPTGT